jgi:hypothetical protein
MSGFRKHRRAEHVWAFDFIDYLALLGPTVVLQAPITMQAAQRNVDGSWTDVTADVIEATTPAPDFDPTNKLIIFTAKAAAANKQLQGAYGIFASAPTNDGRVAVGTASLTIDDDVTGPA